MALCVLLATCRWHAKRSAGNGHFQVGSEFVQQIVGSLVQTFAKAAPVGSVRRSAFPAVAGQSVSQPHGGTVA